MNSFGKPYILEVRLDQSRIPPKAGYPFTLPIVKKFKRLKLDPAVTFLVGENGSGKSTLLEAIAVNWGFNAEGGSKNFRFSNASAHSVLYEYLTLVKSSERPKDGYFLRAESYFNLASEIDKLDAEPYGGGRIIDSYGGVSLHSQSHGESFLALFLKRFYGNGLYILDEPEAALSPDGLLKLLARMEQLVCKGSQFIVSTHSPLLLLYPRATIYELQGEKLVKTPFDQTRHYQLTRDLLNHPNIVQREITGAGE